MLAIVVAAAMVTAAGAADRPEKEKGLVEQSLPYRTALHRDPSMESPFERLLAMYRNAGRVEELIGMYQAHLARYPADVRALVVLIRLLAATGDLQAANQARSAAAQNPDHGYIRYLLYTILKERHDPDALSVLDEAIEKETVPGRKRTWIDQLVEEAMVMDRRALAEKHLKALGESVKADAEERLEAARKMIRHKFHALARALLGEQYDHPPSPELSVEIELTTALAEVGLGMEKDAAGRLDALLSRLTPDYWRREEILRRRIALVKSEAERNTMTKAAKDRVAANPKDETAVLDLAQFLDGFGFRRDALEVLLEGVKSLPSSARIEKGILELFDRVRDERGREEFLAERSKALPDRADLAHLHIKSLFLLNRREEAMSELKALTKNMDPEERARVLAETARFLRRSSLVADASSIFRDILEESADMIGVRRELAETLIATGDRQGARELFADGMPGEAETEDLLDAVQFMLKLELFIEARAVLRQAMEKDPANMEIRALLLNIESRLGSLAVGEKLILETRALADTPARYRLWLESAVAFFEGFESSEAFLGEEKVRIVEENGEWIKNRLDRFLAFVDVASRNGFKSVVADLLGGYLETELPKGVRSKLRRRLIALLQTDLTQAVAVEEHLRILATEDASASNECSARLLLMYKKANNWQKINEMLDTIDLKKLNDPTLLSSIESIYGEYGREKEVLEILSRLTVLDPTNRGNWERWITAMAQAHDEVRLRGGIRKLLMGIDKMPLSDDVRSLLQSHLADSYWRSIAAHLWNPDDTALAEAASLLDTVERGVRRHEEWLWVTWARAHVFASTGRTRARDEAIGELERVIREKAAMEEAERKRKAEQSSDKELEKTDDGKEKEELLVFPDGLAVSLSHARKLLVDRRDSPRSPPPGTRNGPLPALRVAWAFDTHGAPVTGMVGIGDSRMIISDEQGTIYCVDSVSGKVLWDLGGAIVRASVPGTPLQHRYSHGYVSNDQGSNSPPPPPVCDAQGRIYVPSGRDIRCISPEDGSTLWRARIAGSSAGMAASGAGTIQMPIFTREHDVIACDTARGVVAWFDPGTGKLLREKVVPQKPHSGERGAYLEGGRLLLYGSTTVILNADTGEEEWSFRPDRVRKFPVKLLAPEEKEPSVVSMASPPVPIYMSGRGGSRSYTYFVNYLGGSSYQSRRYHSHYRGYGSGASPVALVAPPVVWTQQQSGRYGMIHAGRLLLFQGSQVSIHPLDLPFTGREVSVSGVVVGSSGQFVCIMGYNQVSSVDVNRGTVCTSSVSEVADKDNKGHMQAVADGPVVYVTGPKGILLVNPRKQEKGFFTPWPKDIAPEQKPVQGGAAGNEVSRAAMIWLARHGGSESPSSASRRYMTALVDGGRFYTTITPSRVVALTGGGGR